MNREGDCLEFVLETLPILASYLPSSTWTNESFGPGIESMIYLPQLSLLSLFLSVRTVVLQTVVITSCPIVATSLRGWGLLEADSLFNVSARIVNSAS